MDSSSKRGDVYTDNVCMVMYIQGPSELGSGPHKKKSSQIRFVSK